MEYQIEVKNPNGNCKGVKKVTMDGKAVASKVFPFEAGKNVVNVEITLEAQATIRAGGLPPHDSAGSSSILLAKRRHLQFFKAY